MILMCQGRRLRRTSTFIRFQPRAAYFFLGAFFFGPLAGAGLRLPFAAVTGATAAAGSSSAGVYTGKSAASSASIKKSECPKPMATCRTIFPASESMSFGLALDFGPALPYPNSPHPAPCPHAIDWSSPHATNVVDPQAMLRKFHPCDCKNKRQSRMGIRRGGMRWVGNMYLPADP
jgi:hypothetical protein